MFDTIINALFALQLETVVLFFLILSALAHMLSSRKKPRSMIAWLLVIFLLPYIGIPLYIIFSGRKIEKSVLQKGMLSLKQSDSLPTYNSLVSDFLSSQNIPSVTNFNSVKICQDGVDAYHSLMKYLNNATKSIYISTYIFGDDDVTKEIIDLLSQKAKDGLEVKLLVDALGSVKLEWYSNLLTSLSDAGGECQFFNSFKRHPVDFKINLRNHRKMIIVDHSVVMSGGMNIAKEYLSPRDHPTLWMDLSFILDGEAVKYYLDIFSFDWYYTTQKQLNINIDILKDDIKKESLVQVVPSGPDVKSDALYEALMYGFFLAQKNIYIVTPYFAPDQAMMDALIVAKHRGVDITIVVPNMSDHKILDIARNGFLRELQDEGIHIYFYKNRMLHAKLIIVDDSFAVMGSCNFDERSFFYNYESVSFFYSTKDIYALKKWMQKLLTLSREGLYDGSKLRILIENIFKMLSPAL